MEPYIFHQELPGTTPGTQMFLNVCWMEERTDGKTEGWMEGQTKGY